MVTVNVRPEDMKTIIAELRKDGLDSEADAHEGLALDGSALVLTPKLRETLLGLAGLPARVRAMLKVA